MRKKELIQKIESLEKRIIELEHPVELKNGQEVRVLIPEGNKTGIVIDSEVRYRTTDGDWHSPFRPFDYRKYQVLSEGLKYWYTRNELETL